MTKPAEEIPLPSIAEALAVVRAELAVWSTLLRELDDSDWHRPTECQPWDVHDVVAHVIGQAEGIARPNRTLRRVRAAKRAGTGVLDGHNRLQVQERADVPDEQLIAELEMWGGRALKAASRIPAPVRRLKLSHLFPEAARMVSDSLDFLIRVIMARDTWMHRIDITHATGRTPTLGPHDALIVEQVIRDLALTWHGPSVALHLTGPAGGHWLLTSDARPYRRSADGPTPLRAERLPAQRRLHHAAPAGEHGLLGGEGSEDGWSNVTVDAVACMRMLSGRTAGKADIDGDPDIATALLNTHVEF